MYYAFLPPNPLVIVVCLMLYRETIGARRERKRKCQEASNLATAISIELQNLLEHYSDDMALLDQNAGLVLSLRTPGAVFRGYAGRLAGIFDERVLVPVVKVYSNHERIEAILQACAKPQNGRGARPDADDIYARLLRERFASGVELVEAAICAITLTWPVLNDNSVVGDTRLSIGVPSNATVF